MKSALSFLIAARECEIGELEQLALTSALVSLVGRLIHALQKERGISNVYLGSQGRRFGEQRAPQALECDELALLVRERFEELYSGPHSVRNGARLFARIAAVLHGLDELPDLRERIGARTLGADESTAAFVRLISGLLAVVFEAADSANDPQISRALVAMFNFMQGKEFTGQERAFGSAAFVSGSIDAERQQRWLHLIESQDRWLTERENEDPDGIAVVDAALMIESGGYKRFDRLIVVWCEPAIQLARLMTRDRLSESEAAKRIASQMPQEEKKRYADYLIDTSGEFAETRRQVEALWQALQSEL